ncbi:MAG: type VI secretion system baseplate subunit TssG [Phycisphaerae bacterium]
MIDALREQPWRFEFFQAVRLALLESAARRARSEARGGGGDDPADEPLRFEAHTSTAFPTAALAEAGAKQGDDRDGATRRTMRVNFFGLTGPSGVLPAHFTNLLIELERAKNPRVSAFQNLFNHRLVALFYRAWEKPRVVVGYERARRSAAASETGAAWRVPLLRMIVALCGYSPHGGFAGRHEFGDDAIAYYSGHLAQQRRPASAIAAVVASYFCVRAVVEPFVGQWLRFSAGDRTRLDGRGSGSFRFIGESTWDIQGRFRVRIGPLAMADYLRFLRPAGPHEPEYDPHSARREFFALVQLVQACAAPEYDFEIVLVLRREDVTPCALGGAGDARLGHTTFLCSRAAEHDTEAASFVQDDLWVRGARPAAEAAHAAGGERGASRVDRQTGRA